MRVVAPFFVSMAFSAPGTVSASGAFAASCTFLAPGVGSMSESGLASSPFGDSDTAFADETGWASGFVALFSNRSGLSVASGSKSAEGMRGAPLSLVSSSSVRWALSHVGDVALWPD